MKVSLEPLEIYKTANPLVSIIEDEPLYEEEPREVYLYGYLKGRERTKALDSVTGLDQLFVLGLNDDSLKTKAVDMRDGRNLL